MLLLFCVFTVLVNGHGALVDPPTRNRIDASLPWNMRTPPEPCTCANKTAGSAGPHSTEGCDNAQACYWYSQGCTIGCPTCDSVNGRQQADLCGKGKAATVNDPNLRTVNRNASAGSKYDIYKHNPWRAPGSAAVVDACGLAGGTPWGKNVSEWGWYVPTKFAQHGDHGSKLPPQPSGRVWKVGSIVEAIWQITANHGGGYTYRLCPASEELTEDCFRKYPIKFAGRQMLQYDNGTRLEITPTYVTEGVEPKGSMWAMNPIPPRCLGGDCKPGNPCVPCSGTPGSDCTTCDNTPDPCFPPPCDESDEPGICSGNQPARGRSTAVVDTLIVPDLPSGNYVLGWRLDCEATAQVWSNCADITLVK